MRRSQPTRQAPTTSRASRTGNIALIQRGGCSFALKVANAQTAGADAVIIFNQGDPPDARSGVLTTSRPCRRQGSAFTTIMIPVVGASFAAGRGARRAGLDCDRRRSCNDPQSNVIAEPEGKNDDNVVMAGAHLDSVPAGPGDQRQRVRLGRAARDGRA